MCRETFDEPPIRGGFEHPFSRDRSLHRWRILFTFLPFTISTLFATCEARASNAANVHKLTSYGQIRRMHHEYPNSNYIKDEWQQANLYKGHSGDPWGSMSMKKQNGYVHRLGLPSLNSTYNDTRSGAFLSQGGKTLPRTRFKRGVVHLYNMVVCATGCNPLSYKGYGCYCGFLGSGYVIDGIDRCCKMHDWCYDATECPMFSEYFVPYYWRCYHGYKPVCAVEHGNLGASGSCAQRLCECDRSLAECLRRYPCPTTKAVCTSSPWRLVQNLFMIM